MTNDFALGILSTLKAPDRRPVDTRTDFAEGIARAMIAPRTTVALETLRWAGAFRTRRAALAVMLGYEVGKLSDIARAYRCRPRSIRKQLAKIRAMQSQR
jgi:hypothetical protein